MPTVSPQELFFPYSLSFPFSLPTHSYLLSGHSSTAVVLPFKTRVSINFPYSPPGSPNSSVAGPPQLAQRLSFSAMRFASTVPIPVRQNTPVSHSPFLSRPSAPELGIWSPTSLCLGIHCMALTLCCYKNCQGGSKVVGDAFIFKTLAHCPALPSCPNRLIAP